MFEVLLLEKGSRKKLFDKPSTHCMNVLIDFSPPQMLIFKGNSINHHLVLKFTCYLDTHPHLAETE